MPAKKSRICQICQTSFQGRKDAKTCSPACRKRLQRQLQSDLTKKAERMESALGKEFHRLSANLFGEHASLHAPLIVADERGSIAVAEAPKETASPEPIATPVESHLESTALPREAEKRFTPSLANPTPEQPALVVKPEEVAPDQGTTLESSPMETVSSSSSSSSSPSNAIHMEDMMSTESLDGSYNPEMPEVNANEGGQAGGSNRGNSGGRFSLLRYNKLASTVTGMAIVAIVLLSLGSFFLLSSHNSAKKSAGGNSPSSYAVGNLPLGNLQPNQSLRVGEASQLTINGELKVNRTLVLTPGSTPTSPVTGQIYYDQATNQPYYYNGSQFLPLGSQKAVTSLGGSQGNIGVGNGLSLTNGQLTISDLLQQQINTAISNNNNTPTNGVTGLAGTANQIIVSAGTGNVTLSLPQSIAVSSSPTFAGLAVNGTLSVSTLQRGSPGNDLAVYAGSDNITFTANGRTFILPNVGPSSQTICTTGYTCATGPGTAVILQPGSAQADSGAGSSIFINNTGGGNLLQLQGAGTNSFVVSNAGNLTARGDMTLQGGDLVLGTTTTPGAITFNSGTGTGTGRLQLGGTLPVGGVTYVLPTPASSGTQTLCTVELGNCAGSGAGVTTLGGTNGVIAMFTGSQSIADSILSQAGTTLTAGGNMVVNAASGFSGNLLNLEVNGSSKLSVNQSGDTIVAGTLTVNGTGASTIAGGLSVGNGLSVTSGGANITGTTTVTGSGIITNTLEIQGANALTLGKSNVNSGAIVFRGSGGNGLLTLVGPSTPSVGNYTLSIPTILGNDTICTNTTQATACSNYAPAGGSGNYIRNGTSPQTADFNITGTGTAGTFAATTLLGNGAGITSLNGSNVSSGTVGNAYLTNSGALTVSAGTGLNGGGLVALGGTTTLNVTYGSGIGTAVEGNTALTCASGTGNLTGGGNVVTLGAGGSCNGITITDSPTFAGTLTIQGSGGVVVGVPGSTAGSLTLANGSNSYVSILQAAAPTGTGGNATFTLPSIAGGTSDEICTVNAGNCAGSGTGVTTPGGTTGYIPVFTGSQSVADSVISQSGTAVNVAGTLAVTGSGSLALGTASGNTGSIKFYNSANGNSITLQAGATTGNLALTLPTSDGSNGQCLQTDGSGALSFNDCTGGSAGGVSTLDGLAGNLTLDNSSGSGSHITIDDAVADGTTKGIATFNATNFINDGPGVINTVQDISTTSNPTFASLVANNGIKTGAGAGTQRIDATGNLVNIGTIASGLINGQNISSTANFTGTVAIQGANSLALGTASTNTGSIAFYNSAGGNTITIQGPAANPGGNYTLTLPTLSANDTFCLAAANNCSATGSAGGDLSGSYPNPTVVGIQGNPVVFTSLSAGDVLQYDGSNIVNGKITDTNLQGGAYASITGVGNLTTGQISGSFGAITTGSNISTTATLHGDTLTAGSANQFQVDASGNLTIANAAAVQGANGLQLGVSNSTPGILSFANASNSNLSVIQADAPTGTGNANFTLPSIAGGTSDEICTVNAGNCAGTGAGVTTPGGSVGALAYFTGSQVIASSILSQSGTTLTAAGNLVVNAASGFTGNLINLETNASSKFSVDESGNSIQGGTLTVNGTGASSVAGTLSIGTLGTNGSTVLCSNAGTISSCSSTGGSGNFILNGTSPQTANFNITGSGTVGSFTANGDTLVKTSSPTAFQVQNSSGGNLILADTSSSRVGINTGALALNTNLNVYNSQPSTTQTDLTQNLSRAGINFMTDYVQDAYTGGLFWSTQNNNPTAPKAGIYTQLTNNGSKLLFGTSGSYSAGLTNSAALTLGYNGEAIFRNGFNTPAGFQIQNATGTGLFTVDTTTGAALTSSLYVDTLGSAGTTALCWNGSNQVSSCASTGSIGFWNRTGTTLSPANAGDNITTTGTYNTNTFNSNTLQFGAAGTATIDSASGQILQIGTGANAHNVTLGSTTGTSQVNIQGGSGNGASGDINIGTTALASGTRQINIGATASTGASTSLLIATSNNGSFSQSVTIGSVAAGNSSTTLQSGSTGAININSVGASTLASTTHIADTTNATAAQVVTIGSKAANSGNNTTIQGGSGSSAINLVTATGGTINIGAVGASTNASTVHIADQSNGSGNQTVSIGSTNGSSTVLIQGGSPGAGAGISLVSGTAPIQIGANATAHEVDINSTTGAAKTVISSGTGGILLSPSGGSNTGVIVQPVANSTSAFQIQKAGAGGTLFNADTQNSVVTVTAGTDSSTLGSTLFTGSLSGTGWTTSGTGASATATHTTGTTAVGPSPAVSISSGNRYFVNWTITNPNPGGTLTLTMGGQTLATYSFDNLTGGTYSFGDSNTILASSTANLQITPNSSFTGTVSGITVQLMTYNSSPALVVNNTSGGASLEARASSDNGTLFLGYNAGTQNNPNDGAYGNTGVGSWALQYNVNGARNTALGAGALESNSSGDDNVALGYNALQANTSGFSNVAIGAGALQSETWGASNIAIGDSALASTVAGYDNVGIGHNALASVTSNYGLVAIGSGSGESITTGGGNTAVGYGTLRDDVTGYNNTALGQFALQHVLGNENIGIGLQALAGTTAGSQNTVVGTYALSGNSLGNANTILGYSAGNNLASGDGNILLGYEAGFNLTSGSNNILIGANAPSSTGSNQLNVGDAIYGDLSTGAIKLQNSTNTSNAFQILQASTNASLFNADTTNMNISLQSGYSGETSGFSATTSLPSPGREGNGVLIANGYIYSFAGSVSGGGNITTVSYAKINANGTVGTWANTTSIGGSGDDTPGVVFSNGYIYVMGGVGLSTIYYARPAADGTISSWTTASTTMPASQQSGSGIAANNGYIYLVGGGTGTTATAFARQNADGTLGTFTSTGATLPAARTALQSVIANGYIYAFGGWSGSTSTSTVYKAPLNKDGTITSGAWTATGAAAMPFTRHSYAAALMNGYVYLMGGISSSSNVNANPVTTNTVMYAHINADGTISSWKTSANGVGDPNGLRWVSGAAANGYLYTVGGDDGSGNTGPVQSVYYTSVSRVQIAGSLDLVGINGGNLANPGTGGTLTAGDTTIAGALQVQGMANFAQNVSVNGTLTVGDSISVGGTALFKNSSNSTSAFQIQNSSGTSLLTADTTNMKLTVAGLEVTGNLTLDSHIITTGTAPTCTPDTTHIGNTGTCSVSGNDISGTITINGSGTGFSNGRWASITFHAPFGSTPHVTAGPSNSNAGNRDPYIDTKTTAGFEVYGTALANSTSATIDYVVMQ